MLLSVLFATSVAFSSFPVSFGYPGMGQQLAEIMTRKNGADEGDSTELLGDLLTLKDSQLTPVGRDIKDLLQGKGNPESNAGYNAPALKSPQCAQDTCCVWKYIANDMEKAFRGQSGRCTKFARGAVRLGFHDAGAWSKATASQGGGADGSIALSRDEINRADNRGLQEIVGLTRAWYAKWHDQEKYPITMADLIQMGANVATVVCPLGPRVRTYVGRVDSAKANPEGLLPSPFASADSLIELFKQKTIGPHGLVALVGAHTTSQQNFVDTTRAGDPQDSTPGVWDVLFYGQTLGNSPTSQRIFKFPSDISLSKHPKTQSEWKEFAGPGGQDHWNEDYAREYIRLSLLGVNNINKLTECTKVLPPATRGYSNKDQGRIDRWLSTSTKNATTEKIAHKLEDGDDVDD